MRSRINSCSAAPVALLAVGLLAVAPPAVAAETAAAAGPADRIAASIDDAALRALIGEVLDRNADAAVAAAAARAAEERAPQAGALPDPTLGVTDFVSSPETRVGPQQTMLSLTQKVPWFGKLGAKRAAAEDGAAAAWGRVESVRLDLVTRARTLYHELAFVEVYEGAVREDRATLVHYEDVARARYESGAGLQQPVIKIQAEITKADARLLDISTHRAALEAQVNALRDRPEGTPVEVDSLPAYAPVSVDIDSLRAVALENRPELDEAKAEIERSASLLALARKDYLPDFSLGVAYTFVGGRTDAAGRAAPPPDDGKDIVGVSAAVNLPIWRGKLSAGVEEAGQERRAAEERRRGTIAGIEGALGDLVQRLPLTGERLKLLQDVLTVQAEESLRSADAAYTAGTLGALDLLDAERVLLEVRITAARARADYANARADLEGAVGAPLPAK